MSKLSGYSVSGRLSNPASLSERHTGFQQRCTETLERLGDIAIDSQNYIGAAKYFSRILSLNPVDRMGILIKRSNALALMNSWAEALRDADEVCFMALCFRKYQ